MLESAAKKGNEMSKLMIPMVGMLLFSSVAVQSQKGTGAADGIVRQNLELPVTEMTGELAAVKTGPCERTSGKSPLGTHLLIKSGDRMLNLHLGPAEAVRDVVEQLDVGDKVVFDAFRTDRLPANAYIAKSITLDDNMMELRDDHLRPRWASGRGGGAKKRPRGPCW